MSKKRHKEEYLMVFDGKEVIVKAKRANKMKS